MDKRTILVTGANGQLGKCLQDIAPLFPAFEFIFKTRQDLSIDDKEAVSKLLLELRPFALINAAAYTAVDKAESESDLAYLRNATAPAHMAAVCHQTGARFLHVSTDYVFNGNADKPYTEDEAVDPINTYGASKQKGEALISAGNPDAVIVRTSWVYCQHGNNFVKTMLRLMQERPSLNIVSDQTGCPTYAIDLAEALMTIVSKELMTAGIYHFSNSGPISWYEFAVAIKELTGVSCDVHPIPTASYPTPAKRPYYSVMSNEKIRNTFAIQQKDWKQRLKECLALLRK